MRSMESEFFFLKKKLNKFQKLVKIVCLGKLFSNSLVLLEFDKYPKLVNFLNETNGGGRRRRTSPIRSNLRL